MSTCLDNKGITDVSLVVLEVVAAMIVMVVVIGRSRHSAKEANLICFPVYRFYFFVEGGEKGL